MSSPTDVFIQRPVLAAVISMVLALLGAMGALLLPVRETPDVQNPVVTVTTAWPGADPSIVESDVTEVLERVLNGIEGVRTITSSSQDGNSQITVEFELDRDLEDAANDVRSRVSRVRNRLPDDIDEPVVEKADSSAQPVMFLRLAAADGRSLLEVTEIADTLVRDRLENIEGVSSVDIYGAQIWAIRIEVDAARLAARGLTLSDVSAALSNNNADLPAGRVEGAATTLSVHLDGGLATPEEFGALVLRADGADRVYLRDVANIRMGAENERTSARADLEPSVSVALIPQAKANIIDVSNETLRRLEGIQADLPAGLTLVNVYDRADAVRASIHDVNLTLGVAFGLVVLVIFGFLRDARSTLVPTLAIPVSIIGTPLVLWAAGFSINVFTLFGLVLAIGLVVDDAIVVLENIVRRIEAGESVMDASILGTRQIAPAVVATTLSLVAVFMPVIFTGGATGRLFLEFGTTVAASVFISMIVALTLTPMLCSRLLVPTARARSHDDGLIARLFGRSLSAVTRRPIVVLPALALALAAVWLGFNKLPREFFPTEDRNFMAVRTQAQEGASFAWMDARMREVEAMLQPLVPERRVMLSRVATGPGGVVAGTNSGLILFPLKPRAERERSQGEIVAALKGPLSQVTAFRTIPIQFPTVGRGFSPPLQFVLQNADFGALTAELPRFVRAMREIPGLSSVNEDLRLDRPELWLTVDRERAAELGVPIRDIARTLQVLSNGIDLSTFKRGVRQHKVFVSLPLAERATPEQLSQIHVRTRDGRLVALSNLVQTEEKAGAASRFHYNRAPSATISANLDGITLGEGIARVQAMADKELPAGFRTALAGESKDFAESSASLAGMFGLALALVYLLLAAQFDSFVAPISIMLTVPLALAGAFGALFAMGLTLSFFGQVGLILLIGLVTKNGILIVEYAEHIRHEQGLSVWAAAEEATKLRFRPILMTSVATIGGAIPIALGLSGQSRASLGVAVVGGMLAATVLTLYVTPVVYATLAGLRRSKAPPAAAALLLAAVVGAGVARAAEPMTLVDALRITADQNLDIKRADEAVSAAEAGVRGARSDLLPSVYGAAGLAWGNDPRSRLGAGDGSSTAYGTATLRADLSLVDLSALADLSGARAGLDAQRASAEATLEAALAETARLYVALQQQLEARVAADARLAQARRLRDRAASRVELGASPPIDGTRAELALKTEEQRVLAASTAERAARLALAEQLGLDVDAPLALAPAQALADPSTLPGDEALDQAIAQAFREHPAVLATDAAAQASEADQQAAARLATPTLSAYGQVGAYSDLAGTSAGPVEVVGLSATVPLYGGGAVRAATDAAAASARRDALAAEQARREVERALRVSLSAARDAAVGLGLAEARLALARDELAQAESRYAEGADDNLVVVTAQTALAQAEQGRIDALASYNLALVSWYAAQGRLRGLL